MRQTDTDTDRQTDRQTDTDTDRELWTLHNGWNAGRIFCNIKEWYDDILVTGM